MPVKPPSPPVPAEFARSLLLAFLGLGLSACLGTTPPMPVGVPTGPAPVATTTVPPQSEPVAAAAETGRFAFAPLTGAPQPVADRLASSIAAASTKHDVALAPLAPGNGAYIVKGYMSAVTEANATRAIYVWDVLDGKHTRLNRISGSVTVPVTADNPWDAIGGATLDQVAARTVGALAAWRMANGG